MPDELPPRLTPGGADPLRQLREAANRVARQEPAPDITFEESLRHVAELEDGTTWTIGVTPEEARELLSRLKK